MHSVCCRYALGMHSVCTPHAVDMPSVCCRYAVTGDRLFGAPTLIGPDHEYAENGGCRQFGENIQHVGFPRISR